MNEFICNNINLVKHNSSDKIQYVATCHQKALVCNLQSAIKKKHNIMIKHLSCPSPSGTCQDRPDNLDTVSSSNIEQLFLGSDSATILVRHELRARYTE